MSQNQIKWLAAILMLIDHIGFMIEAEPMRIIGRLSFPLFCWVLARNWERRVKKPPNALIGRLLFFGIISQFPYFLLVNKMELNVLLSFLVCVLIFSEIHITNKKLIKLLSGMVAAQFLNVSYGWFAIACPLLMISFKGSGKKGWWFCWISANILYTVTCGYFIQIVATITPLILAYHNPAKDKKPGAIEKNFFYYFYPIHLAGLAALRTIL
jgi:hypothetical protein